MSNTCFFMLISILLAVITSRSIAAWCGYKRGDGFQNPSDGVCSNVDIRITMDQFRTLENCTVVEGFLHISLIERAVHEDYEKWSFPELREITGYLRLYRVYGLKTLRHLFPNLTVIGGRQLFNNYALVVYEMPDLEELGLISLRTISRGGVRITKSKKLCYVDTVDWERIGVDAGAQDFKDNKEENQCANYCPENCPTSKVGNLDAKRCWTSQHCQLGLNCRCKVNQTCMPNGTCCHDFCVGGCVGTGPQDCYSCKGVTYQGRCYGQCPHRTFMFSERRCLTDKECLALVNNTQDIGKNTKILRGERDEHNFCVTKCPQNYTIREEGALKNLECVKCQGFCPKVCNSTEVTSIEDAEKLNGCSKIIGPLIIQIMSGSKGNVAQEMEKNLGNIKEVTGYISIRRSYALLTLYFLKSLEIFGHSPLFQNHSLVVMDNSNLQELFPEEQMKKMKFKHGKVFFHGNRKLCLYKIDNFVKYLNLSTPPTEQDISRATNGDLISCSEWHLNLTMPVILHNAVVLNWTKDTSDTRHLMTYIINYKEIKDESDIDIYQGRDVCSTDVWMTHEQAPSTDSEPFQTYELNDLKANTKYAVYVQAYTLPTATYAAITNVETFSTKPYYPSEPLDLEVSSDDPQELTVKWKPPKFPNGNVTHYTIVFYKQELAIKSFKQRDYCREPNSAPKETLKEKENEAEKKQNLTASCCVCPKSKEEEDAEARKREIEIYFENYLHDQVYCRRYDTLPPDVALRGISWEARLTDFINLDRTSDGNNTDTSKTNDIMVIVKDNASFSNSTSERNVQYNTSLTMEIPEVLRSNVTKVVLSNLKHFQEYNIEVQACHDTDINKPNDTKRCSIRAMTAGRTKPSRVMDNINESTINVKIVVNITADVLITWEPPPDPNGLILTYNIFYKRANQENLVARQICVNSKDYQKHSGYYLANLDHGNWTFQISAVSLAGNGSLTSDKYFLVPYSPEEMDTYGMISAVTILVVVTVVIIVISLLLFLKFRFHLKVLTVISPNINYVPSDQMYTMDDWEVDRDKITILEELGQGSFGMVYKGVAKGLGDDPDKETHVAIKTVNDRANFNDRREFLKEATTMKAFDCFHVVKLLGVVSTSQPALVIMELMEEGDLKNFLRKHRPDENDKPGVCPPKLLDILQMAGEIADGMAYLADKKFVHRDLAARNCMVAADKTVKIGDFGMTRDIYETDYYRKGGRGMLPVRWMAPESLKDGVFTSMSDVWSYGIVMWEMVTLAAQPYQGLSNDEVVKFVSEDYIMDIPDRCPDKMANMMKRCWVKRPKHRPTFKDIIEYLLPHMNSNFQKVSYFYNGGGANGHADGCDLSKLDNVEGTIDGFNSLNSEGAAVSRLSLKANRIFPFNGSPHSEAETLSLYDDETDSVRYTTNNEDNVSNKNNLNVVEQFGDSGSRATLSDLTLSVSDSNCPFMLADAQTTPSTTRWRTTKSPLEKNGNSSMLDNLGFVELQPLINKDHVLTSHSKPTDKSSKSDPSEYVIHQSPTVREIDQKIPQSHDTTINATADFLQADPPTESSSLWQPVQHLSTNPTSQSSVSTLPALKLPTLNQPPGGGFHRAALYTPADSSTYSIRNNQHVSSSQPHSQPGSLSAKPTTVSVQEETYPASLNNSQPGAISNYSGSSKNSVSHPVIHEQTNGHVPMSTLCHKTTPC